MRVYTLKFVVQKSLSPPIVFNYSEGNLSPQLTLRVSQSVEIMEGIEWEGKKSAFREVRMYMLK